MKSCRIITGGKGEGKSSKMMNLALSIPDSAGFIMPVSEDGYSLYDIRRKITLPFMTSEPIFPCRIGKWYYDQNLFDYALAGLSDVHSGTVLLDEVGRLEVMGGGYAPLLRALIPRDIDLIISVRRDFADDVIRSFFPEAKVEVEGLS